MTKGRGLWRSTGLRLAVFFGFLVLVAVLFTLSLVYIQVSAVLHRNVDRQLQQMQERLTLQYAFEGPEVTAQTIRQVLHDGRDTDLELVLLTTPSRRYLAGNIDVESLPPLATMGAAVSQLNLSAQTVHARLIAHSLPDGALLVLGHDLRELRDIESTLATASLVAGLFSLSLALIGAWLFRHELGRSVDALHQTITRIASGQLHERVLLENTPDDEFARLEQDFNHMLDRIEQLMDGVTHVSDEIAHNLRTPLTRLRLRLQAAHDTAPGIADLRGALQSAMHDIDDLSRVLDKLLAIAQAESGTRRAPFAPTSWEAIGEDVVELYEALAEHEGVALLWTCEHPAPVLGDRHLLAGALVNVVDNAIKYGGKGAHVEVCSRVFMEEGTLWSELVVRDDGPGAPPEAIPALGQRFLRLRPELPGHGLGLASVHAVMRLHGGSMRIEPANPGLRVVLRLPAP
ncbi:MAG: ATP-binding protein [Ottowia sp.]|uniref:ATP-binding protein n=1 Tax=Ottowia sp. TaxID=1898956 RepID=UPI003C708217